MKSKLIIFISLFILLVSGCKSPVENEETISSVKFDLDKIKERGKIVAITGYNAYSYFIYRGKPMGFEYELAEQLGDYLGLKVEIKVVKSISQMFAMLDSGEGDIIAFNLTVTKDRTKRFAFTQFHHTTRQVLVQRRPEKWRYMKMHEIEDSLIRSPLDLEGKTVHVRKGSAYMLRLKNLSEEIGGDINIVEAGEDLSTEDLIEMVADGEIDYTVSDENIALLNQSYYSNLDVGTHISLPQKIAWAVRKNAPKLLDTLNTWLTGMKKKTEYYVMYNKYFRNRNDYRSRVKSDLFLNNSGKISEYDDLLKQYSEKLDWDWRILASLIYQESRFDPKADSWAGAVGLMQLLPATAQQFGVTNLKDPKQNLEAGVNYLIWLDDFWSELVKDKNERIKFVLASYNIGMGHILDSRKLAEKFGANPNVWFGNVEEYLLKKSKQKYYNDEVVKYGFARGVETVKYVHEILERFDQYKVFIS